MLRWHDNRPVDRGDKEVESRPLIFLFWQINFSYESSLVQSVSYEILTWNFGYIEYRRCVRDVEIR